MTEAAPGRRQRIVEVAHGWADSLIDQTGRNQLLFCRDRGKLLLDDVPDVARLKLMAGRKVRLTELFPEPEEHARAAKVLEKIRGRVKEYDEEQGIRVGRLASAFASWKDRKDRTVRAPVLLRDVEISRGAAGFGDHDITVNPDVELNPVLLAHLDSTFKVAVDRVVVDELSELEDEIALEQLLAIYATVPEFRIEPGLLIGTFHYAKLAMFEDLATTPRPSPTTTCSPPSRATGPSWRCGSRSATSRATFPTARHPATSSSSSTPIRHRTTPSTPRSPGAASSSRVRPEPASPRPSPT